VSLGARQPLLTVSDLRVDLETQNGVVHAVRGLSYQLNDGEVLGMVGESGSGKSVSALALMGLLPPGIGRVVDGRIEFDGRDLGQLPPKEMRRLRGRQMAMVFQDPMSSLNPVRTVGSQISEVLSRHLRMRRAAARDRVVDLLERVGIPDAPRRYNDYPHQFSGGMRQRVMIAMGVACNPKLLIADEPTTALDVSVQAQILDLFEELRRELDMALLLITHDLGVVARLVDRVLVVYAGRVVESGRPEAVFTNPSHPYTLGLLESMPRIDAPRQRELHQISGMPPDLSQELTGCPFVPRCPLADERCRQDPVLTSRQPGHDAACWGTT
jgi:oligopeptide transport system ATP-binding protein